MDPSGGQFGIAKRWDQRSVGSKRKDLLVLSAWEEDDRPLRSDGGVLWCIPCHCKGAVRRGSYIKSTVRLCRIGTAWACVTVRSVLLHLSLCNACQTVEIALYVPKNINNSRGLIQNRSISMGFGWIFSAILGSLVDLGSDNRWQKRSGSLRSLT